jgi:hypothetical protein
MCYSAIGVHPGEGQDSTVATTLKLAKGPGQVLDRFAPAKAAQLASGAVTPGRDTVCFDLSKRR